MLLGKKIMGVSIIDLTAPFKMYSPHSKCIRLGSLRSSHLPFKMHLVCHVRSSLLLLIHFGSIATPKTNIPLLGQIKKNFWQKKKNAVLFLNAASIKATSAL